MKMVMIKHSDLIPAFVTVFKFENEKPSVAFSGFSVFVGFAASPQWPVCFPNRMRSVNQRGKTFQLTFQIQQPIVWNRNNCMVTQQRPLLQKLAESSSCIIAIIFQDHRTLPTSDDDDDDFYHDDDGEDDDLSQEAALVGGGRRVPVGGTCIPRNMWGAANNIVNMIIIIITIVITLSLA